MVQDDDVLALAAHHREHGWGRIDDLVDADEVAWLAEIVDRLLTDAIARSDAAFNDLTGPFGASHDGEPAVPQVMAPHLLAPELLQARFLVRAAHVARVCLGPEAVTNIAMVIAKPAYSPGVVPWHQDAAYWGHLARPAGASIWVPLQDVDLDNGCLSFVSGSHEGDVLPHRHLGGDPHVHALELVPSLAESAAKSAVAVPLRSGQATIHDGHLLHHSGPNRTDRPRRALVLSVRNPARDVPTPGRAPFPWAMS